MRTVPDSIQDTIHDLSPDSLVKLYEVHLKSGASFYLSPQMEMTWQGNTYSDIPCTMTDMKRDSQGRLNRPKFSFANPAGIFTADLYQGLMDNASVVRIRVLYADLLANNNFSIKETFKVSRIMSISKHVASVELRDVLDGHQFRLPARAFYPPEFPHVRL